jgi:hypothetical protein
VKRKNRHAVALGKLGGMRTTAAKAAAARLNGLQGGRPRAVQQDKAPAAKGVSQ